MECMMNSNEVQIVSLTLIFKSVDRFLSDDILSLRNVLVGLMYLNNSTTISK